MPEAASSGVKGGCMPEGASSCGKDGRWLEGALDIDDGAPGFEGDAMEGLPMRLESPPASTTPVTR
ncbi:MAG: hypothetical protein ACK44L_12840 [Burkholderiales bacterium]